MHSETIENLRLHDLTPDDETRWQALVAQRPDLSGPYFDIRYIKAVAKDVPGAGIVRFRDNDTVVGYFPYQIRSGALQPLGAPLTDYHGPVTPADFVPDFDALLKVTGARHLEFQGWIGAMSPRASTLKLKRRLADTSQGFDTWYDAQDDLHHKFFKNVGRCQRNVEKDFGGFDFSWERVTPELLAWTLDLKREQYKKTGMHDVFACGWTETLLRNLAAVEDDGYGLRAGIFRHEGKIVASEISLMGADEVHLWFPAYDPAYYRYSVGILLTVAIIRHLAPMGIKRFDFGTGGEDYKSPLTSEGGDCLEGDLAPASRIVSSLLDKMAKPDTRLSLKRRARVIRATETSWVGWGRAVTRLLQRAAAKLQARLAPRSA